MNRDARNFILDTMLNQAVYWSCAGTVIAALTSFYKVPLSTANLLTGTTSTLAVLQLVGGCWYARTKKKGLFLRGINILWRILLPLTFFSVLLPQNAGVAVMSLCYLLSVAIFQISGPSLTDWLVTCVEGHVKDNYYSIREMCFILLQTVTFCVMSLVLFRASAMGTQKQGFLTVGWIATVLLVLSAAVFYRIPLPQQISESPHPMSPPMYKMMSAPLHNRKFMQVLLTYIIFSFSSMFIGGYYSIYQIRVLNFDFFHIMLWTTISCLVRSLATPAAAKFAPRFGWRNITAASMVLTAFTGFLWMLTTKSNVLYMYPFLSILGAVPNAGLNVGLLKLQVDTIPEHERSAYFSVNSTLNGVASLVGSAACSGMIYLIEKVWGSGTPNLRFIFLLGTFSMLASAILAMRIHGNPGRC